MLTSRNHPSPKYLKQAVACGLLAVVATPWAVGYQTEKAYAAERAATQTRGADGLQLATAGERAADEELSKVPDLEGEWSLVDDFSGSGSQAGPRGFSITRVVLEPNGSSDGYFLFKWRGEARLSRGHFSLNTGRVWFNTHRTVKGKTTRVKYDGRLQPGNTLQLQGTAGQITGDRLEWPFLATKEAKKSGPTVSGIATEPAANRSEGWRP